MRRFNHSGNNGSPSTSVQDSYRTGLMIASEGFRIMYDHLSMVNEDRASRLIEQGVKLKEETERLQIALKKRKKIVHQIGLKFSKLKREAEVSCSSNESSAVKARVDKSPDVDTINRSRGAIFSRDTYDNENIKEPCYNLSNRGDLNNVETNDNYDETNDNYCYNQYEKSHTTAKSNFHTDNLNNNDRRTGFESDRSRGISSIDSGNNGLLAVNDDNNTSDNMASGVSRSMPQIQRGWSLKRSHKLTDSLADPCGFEIGSSFVGNNLIRGSSISRSNESRAADDTEVSRGAADRHSYLPQYGRVNNKNNSNYSNSNYNDSNVSSNGSSIEIKHEGDSRGFARDNDAPLQPTTNKIRRLSSESDLEPRCDRQSNKQEILRDSSRTISRGVYNTTSLLPSTSALSSSASSNNNNDVVSRNKSNNLNNTRKYVESVRNKDARDALPGYTCSECYAMYQMNLRQGIIQPGELYDCLRDCSRHKSKYTPPMTPEGVWDLSIRTPEEWKN